MAKDLPNLLSEVEFGAFLTYSPRGQSDTSRKSKTITIDIKQDTSGVIHYVVKRLSDLFNEAGLREFLNDTVTLVPAPRRAPLVKGALWPAHRICEELVDLGLGREILPCLARIKAVSKSASAAWGHRPDVETHLDSLQVESTVASPRSITVVDDVITRGATLYAAAHLLRAAFPQATVRAFALVRTMGLIPNVDQIIDACVGKLTLENGRVFREP